MIFLLALFLLILAEIAGFVVVGRQIGVAGTLIAVVGTGVLGVALLRNQGAAARERIRDALARDEPPVAEMLDGLAMSVGGVCLLVPGFLTDIFGLLLFIPPVRRAALTALFTWIRQRTDVTVRADRDPRGGVIDAEYSDVTPSDDKQLPPEGTSDHGR